MHRTLTPEPIRLTYRDLCAMPDDGRRYEILDGDLYMSPSPMTVHQRVVLNVAMVLRSHVSAHVLGEVFVAPLDVILSEHDIVEPDVIFVSAARSGIVGDKNIQGVPDLLIEVLSPSNTERDTNTKRNIYARCRVPWYWILDPDRRSILELHLVDGAYATVNEVSGTVVFQPRIFPGLAIKPTTIWP